MAATEANDDLSEYLSFYLPIFLIFQPFRTLLISNPLCFQCCWNGCSSGSAWRTRTNSFRRASTTFWCRYCRNCPRPTGPSKTKYVVSLVRFMYFIYLVITPFYFCVFSVFFRSSSY